VILLPLLAEFHMHLYTLVSRILRILFKRQEIFHNAMEDIFDTVWLPHSDEAVCVHLQSYDLCGLFRMLCFVNKGCVLILYVLFSFPPVSLKTLPV
jgi:hypothetical protein